MLDDNKVGTSEREVIQVGMNPDIKAQWVAALRSGEYRQAKRVLHNASSDSYCCLGVLCDLAVKSGVNVAKGEGVYHEVEVTTFDEEKQTLPFSTMTWAELHDDDPVIALHDLEEGLAGLNDEGLSFPQIADIIEWGL